MYKRISSKTTFKIALLLSFFCAVRLEQKTPNGQRRKWQSVPSHSPSSNVLGALSGISTFCNHPRWPIAICLPTLSRNNGKSAKSYRLCFLELNSWSLFQAAARHQCTYLIEYHKRIFLELGGNKEWLKGLDFIPQKLRDIYDINKILAHKPWMLTKAHIEVRYSPMCHMYFK